MKKIIFFIACCMLSFDQVMNAQNYCDAITAEVLPMSLQPTEGNSDFYGVRVSVSAAAATEISVQGYIHNQASISHGQPFQLTIYPGNTEAQTETDFFEIERGTSVVITIASVFPCPLPLYITSDLQNFINQKLIEINAAGASICSQLNTITTDISSNGSGILTFPNWVRFLQVGEKIDSLNSVWDDIYASKMSAIVDYAFSSGAFTGVDNDNNRSEVWDIIEENYFVVNDDKATSCLEQKFNFISLQSQ